VPLGRGIVEVFEAIPDRIEVSGQDPTWRVTGGSFESVLEYTRQAFGETVVVAREDRSRWWPRVTLTVSQDPALVADAPPVEIFADPPEPTAPPGEPVPAEVRTVEPRESDNEEGAAFVSALEEIFAHQESLRRARRRIPEQRAEGS
jgi:hypothetical protein